MTKKIYSVSQLTRELRAQLESGYRSIWVEGEISGLAAPASGHLYFSLKEKNSIIRSAYFRNKRGITSMAPKNGMQVLVCGQISLYEPRGDLQLIVSFMEEAGEGALRRSFELLKQALSEEGLFDSLHKKSLPPYPKTIGIITSDSGAALQDILTTLARRYPVASVILYPVLVQGKLAPKAITEMLSVANDRNDADVLILARGGGSLEDLQAFNEESVARAIFASVIPVVSGVGHEVDFTIADLVSDLRAATPTAAAEHLSPSITQMKRDILDMSYQLEKNLLKQLQNSQQNLDYLTVRLTHPSRKLDLLKQRRKGLHQQLENQVIHQIGQNRYQLQALKNTIQLRSPINQLNLCKQQLDQDKRLLRHIMIRRLADSQRAALRFREKLNIMSPEHTLIRGYAIVQTGNGDVMVDSSAAKVGESINIKLAKGCIDAMVVDIKQE
ncbi:MAG: exodeoxyribonuclease VII large subunit [Gammaproteobacteria bacterium]|nr:exodeoxyribonuclease VII large subunit [Gammaproteobacteria bacterium]